MIKRDIIFLGSINYILLISTVYGYIDPGTGGMILSSFGNVIAMIVAIIGGFLVRYLVRPLKRSFQKIKAIIKGE